MKNKNTNPFIYKTTIRESHLDTMGHMNNATYLQILEDARWELITQKGFGLEYVTKTGIGPVILEIKMKFIKELSLRQNVVIETIPVSYEGKIGTLQQNIKNELGDICFESIFTFGLFDLKNRKIIAPTKEWLDAIGMNK